MRRTIIEVLIVVLLLIVTGLYLKSCKTENRLQENLRISQLQADVWRDKEGRSHAEIENLKLTNKELRESMPALIDSIKKDFTNVRPRTITKVVTVTSVVHDTIPFPVHNPLSFHYKDKWNEFRVNPDSTLTIAIRDSIVLVSSVKRYGFLKLKTKYTTEVLSYNPKVTLTGLKSIDIIPKERRWGIGVMVGYGMTNKGLSPVVAGGLYYRVW